MPTDSFDERRDRSRLVEVAFGAWLGARGWFILPAYDYSGAGDDKAPKLVGARPADGLITPDLLGFKPSGGRMWWEVKLKSQAVLFRATQTWVTGCSARHWSDYVDVERVTGTEVWVVFAHEQENEVRAASLTELRAIKQAPYNGAKMGRGGMVFFAWDGLRRLCKLSDLPGLVTRPEVLRLA